MTAILALSCAILFYALYRSNKQKKIAYNRYMEDQVIGQPQNNTRFMVTPDGRRVPMWCPNCGKYL